MLLSIITKYFLYFVTLILYSDYHLAVWTFQDIDPFYHKISHIYSYT